MQFAIMMEHTCMDVLRCLLNIVGQLYQLTKGSKNGIGDKAETGQSIVLALVFLWRNKGILKISNIRRNIFVPFKRIVNMWLSMSRSEYRGGSNG